MLGATATTFTYPLDLVRARLASEVCILAYQYYRCIIICIGYYYAVLIILRLLIQFFFTVTRALLNPINTLELLLLIVQVLIINHNEGANKDISSYISWIG